MKAVCIDGHNLALPTGSGIATYSRSLIETLRALGLEASVLHGPSSPVSLDPMLREISVEDARLKNGTRLNIQPSRHIQVALARFGRKAYRVDPSGEILWPNGHAKPAADAFWLSENLFRISGRAFSNSRVVTPVDFRDGPAPDLMHWTYPTPLKARGLPNVYTLHDLIPLKLPHTTLDDKQRFLDLCRSITLHADHIVTVSDTTRRDVIKMLGVDEGRITTTWQTADLPPDALARSDVEVANGLEDIFELPWKGYFIFFGAIEPKKNLGRLVEAYLRSGVKTPLVVVGGRAWLDQDESGFLTELIAEGRGAASRLRRFDYLPRSALIDLIRGARATLFPSLYEGFGLPVLESMMLGTAVMASSAGSLPEIAGDAALITDPYDIDAMAAGLRALDADAALRDDLVIRGRKRADNFSPSAYERRMLNLYTQMGLL